MGDAPLGRGEDRVLGSLPPITFHRDRRWRRQMARCFDDPGAELAETATVRPRCTGGEMTEAHPRRSEATVQLAMINYLPRRLTEESTPTWHGTQNPQ
ncbi:hypothetical protein ACH3Y9_12895 [Streptomyces sp. WSLK1-5]|uniref:hypothetical protein n=1 Tax=unclassified Streptomyces TaxID=2593676 RepID=UPI00379DF04E